jgi:hypothetical protein
MDRGQKSVAGTLNRGALEKKTMMEITRTDDWGLVQQTRENGN